MDAEDLMLRHFLGILDPELAAASARWIRANQRHDGTWSTFFGGPPDLSTTVEAYVALRLAGESADSPSLRAAAEWVRGHGGIDGSRVFTRIWLAVLGRVGLGTTFRSLPPEIMFLPPWAPLNIYDFGCWARQTIVALTVVMAHRPARPLPFAVDELRAARSVRSPRRHPAGRSRPARRLRVHQRPVLALDRAPAPLRTTARWFLPRPLLRRSALRRAEQWIVRRQEADGLWGGIQPPVVYSIMALHLQGYPLDHPVIRAALPASKISSSTTTGAGAWRRANRRCGTPPWPWWPWPMPAPMPTTPPWWPRPAGCYDEEITVPGDWAVRRPGLAPGGWAFEFANDNYPDIDDTAEVVLALRRAHAAADPTSDDACARAVAWTVGMQCADGGWGAFDADNDSRLVAALPFCDFGKVTDPPPPTSPPT